MRVFSQVRKLVSVTAATLLVSVGGLALANSPSAHAAGGTVTCATSAVVGMWVNVEGGKSGWAKLTATKNPNIKGWSYDTKGKRWNANIGCGGKPEKWGQSIHLPWQRAKTTSGTIICVDAGDKRFCTLN